MIQSPTYYSLRHSFVVPGNSIEISKWASPALYRQKEIHYVLTITTRQTKELWALSAPTSNATVSQSVRSSSFSVSRKPSIPLSLCLSLFNLSQKLTARFMVGEIAICECNKMVSLRRSFVLSIVVVTRMSE